jgi:hypothetical protein
MGWKTPGEGVRWGLDDEYAPQLWRLYAHVLAQLRNFCHRAPRANDEKNGCILPVYAGFALGKLGKGD